MICDSCKTDRLIDDFINNQNICYQCMYRLKLEKTSEKQSSEPILCRTCGEEILTKKNLKKRQRTVFCSCACAAKGHKKQLNNHWTRTIRKECC
jgi:hypothetical protein